ncbi:hypothetical protein BBJ28_00018230 [Nothophytophthora sp. Chile5]|nr:hypothetical protein BBJ28_00018230 [Nothophytophthora sp. Chile5]
MRLQASRLCVLPGLALALVAPQVADASTCKTLLDSDNTLFNSLSSWTNFDIFALDTATIFKELDTALPWMSTCTAAIDPKAVYTSLTTTASFQSCLTTLESSEFDLGTSDGWSSVCPLLENTLIPCIKSAMSKVIMTALASTGGCCDALLAEVETSFTDSLDVMVEKLLEFGANVMCSERKYTNLKSVKTTELCGYSLSHAFDYINYIDGDSVLPQLTNLGQVPNDQMCNAFAGNAFTNTKGGSATIGFGTNGVDTMGICLQPVDELVQHLMTWPFFKQTLDADGTSVLLSDLFTTGKSIRGNLLLSWATTTTNLPMIGLRTADKLITAIVGDSEDSPSDAVGGFKSIVKSINSYATALLLHAPNNGNCTYAGQTITEPYTVVSTTTSSPSGAATLLCFSVLATAGLAVASSLFMGLLF